MKSVFEYEQSHFTAIIMSTEEAGGETDPMHFSSPFTIIANRVQRASHSSILCEVKTIDLPESRIRHTIFHNCLRAAGSIPLVGSSNSIFGVSASHHNISVQIDILTHLATYQLDDYCTYPLWLHSYTTYLDPSLNRNVGKYGTASPTFRRCLSYRKRQKTSLALRGIKPILE
uniref:Uncharacterized protein n=1 Tax=Glossina pallidipes TaxID=7398 RepID=A0A1B0A2W7_GLOPL